MGEELLEDIGDLELSAGRCPFAGVFTVLILGDVDGVVHQAHTVIGGLMLKNITVHFAILHDELNDLRRGIRNLDRVRLDMSNSKASFLDLVLEVDHKQGSALGDDVVFVSIVTERVLKAGRSQAVDRVDSDFQGLS